MTGVRPATNQNDYTPFIYHQESLAVHCVIFQYFNSSVYEGKVAPLYGRLWLWLTLQAMVDERYADNVSQKPLFRLQAFEITGGLQCSRHSKFRLFLVMNVEIAAWSSFFSTDLVLKLHHYVLAKKSVS